jgi:hypothetical protein
MATFGGLVAIHAPHLHDLGGWPEVLKVTFAGIGVHTHVDAKLHAG